ncbi:aminotransferase class I/II-fold pyridoxal phosphate-dependent enzyme [Treponema sp. OMZ 840]|uniref:aminotransferase class I/II-fold pyridoxal phosphate-dependent enzyme n=1 Tax=Treponema sp. OMZ 840 TaxID=244313 RepID=UPI003D925CCB
MIHALAQELNTVLDNTALGPLLSDLGRRMFFPKGIIAQSAEAKESGRTANATIGMACMDGSPVTLPSIQKHLPFLTGPEAVAYAPTAGNPKLREMWKQKLTEKNPSLAGKNFSLPIVVPGLTAGISYLCDLFISENDVLLAGDPSWDNYALIIKARRNAQFLQFPMFSGKGFNLDAFRAVMNEESKMGKIRVLLNFPQNPSGYSPTKTEAREICSIIYNAAQKGASVMVWCDDAYFGLNYEPEIENESLFAFLADIHERVVAVKIDGPTKEDYIWGFRTGFLTFAGKGLTEEHYTALSKKVMGIIRSSVSCASTPSQSIMIKALENPDLKNEKKALRDMLERRYRKVRSFVDAKEGHPILEPLPFNSGYFMSLRCKTVSAEILRRKLLSSYGIGTIAIDNETLRIAFSSIDEDSIDTIYKAIYKAAEDLANE